jgi:hypothetical protein
MDTRAAYHWLVPGARRTAAPARPGRPCRHPARRVAAACAGAVLLATGCSQAFAGGTAWEQWRKVPGVLDVAGPRADGRLVVAAAGHLYLAGVDGNLTAFSTGSQGYASDPGTEAYIALSPGQRVEAAGCDFARGDVFALRLRPPVGVVRVDGQGRTHDFATVPGVQTLSGIAFDTTGGFDHQLLVLGPASGRTAVAAIDCRGAVHPVTSSAPVVEGGIAVAPPGFGSFGGALIAPDELSGRIYAIRPSGSSELVVASGLPGGGDIGVEGLGFVPPGFQKGGFAYFADRGTAGNPHPGTDHLLRLDQRSLAAAGLREGDLLVATEGGAATIGVNCTAACRVLPVVQTATTAHGEGHLLLVTGPGAGPAAGAVPASGGRAAGAVAGGVAAILAGVALVLFLARRRRRLRRVDGLPPARR